MPGLTRPARCLLQATGRVARRRRGKLNLYGQKRPPPMRLIESPALWKSAELAARTDWIHHLTNPEVAEIEAALKSVKDRGLGFKDLGKEDFPLERFPKLVAKI